MRKIFVAIFVSILSALFGVGAAFACSTSEIDVLGNGTQCDFHKQRKGGYTIPLKRIFAAFFIVLCCVFISNAAVAVCDNLGFV